MRMKRNKTARLILFIFIAAIICVAGIVLAIYRAGFRYWRIEETGVRYFGRVDGNNFITHGRMWSENNAATISTQRYYIVEVKDSSLFSVLRQPILQNLTHADDVLNIINEVIPEDIRSDFPLQHFIFNPIGADESPVVLHRDTFSAIIRRYESAGNNIIEGTIYTVGGRSWTLVSTTRNAPASFRDFDIVCDNGTSYRGDLLSFLENEIITFASFELSGGSIIKLYPAHNIYRIVYESGLNAGDLFIGAITADLQKNGRGLHFHSVGDIYFGNFIRGEKIGEAMILFTHGGSFVGNVADGRKEGEGVFRWADGGEYSGEFADNLKHGHGLYLFSDGSVYEGAWVNGVRHGYGRFVFPFGDVFEGQFENDLFHGFGRYTWASGEFFEGNFVNNLMHGWGTYHWVGGRTYEGWFAYGEMVLEPPGGFE